MKQTKWIMLAIDILVLWYMWQLVTASNPLLQVYVNYYMQVSRWHLVNGIRYMTGPAWMREAMLVRGRIPFK